MWRHITPGTLYVLIVLAAGCVVSGLAVALRPTASDAAGIVFGATVSVLAIIFADGIADMANLPGHNYRPGWRPTPAWMLAGFFWLTLIALGVAAVLG